MNPSDIVKKHMRHVELSPGAGKAAQDYALAVCEDILADFAQSQYVPQAAPTDLKGALLAICKAVGDHQDSMTPDGSLHLPFVNAVAVLQAHSEPPPSIKNATSHTLFISNESKERE